MKSAKHEMAKGVCCTLQRRGAGSVKSAKHEIAKVFVALCREEEQDA